MIGSENEKNKIIEQKNDETKNDEVKKTETIKPRIIYNLEDTIIQQIAIDKNLVLRVIENVNGKFIDIRKYYKEYPTKKGIRFSYGTYKKLKDLLD